MKMGGYMSGGLFGEKSNDTKLSEYSKELDSLKKMTVDINKFIGKNIINIEGSNAKPIISQVDTLDRSAKNTIDCGAGTDGAVPMPAPGLPPGKL